MVGGAVGCVVVGDSVGNRYSVGVSVGDDEVGDAVCSGVKGSQITELV